MKRTKKWLIAGTVAALTVVTALVALNHWSNGPASGSVHTGAPKTAVTQPIAPAAPLAIQTSLFTTTLPSGFEFKDTSPPTAELPVRLLATSRAARQQVGFTGGKLPSEGLQGVADYHLRATDTTTYRPFTSTQFPAGSATFESADGSMVTLFWPHNGQFTEVTVSGSPGTSSDLHRTLYKILQSWAWK